jgi:hypothetical protein
MAFGSGTYTYSTGTKKKKATPTYKSGAGGSASTGASTSIVPRTNTEKVLPPSPYIEEARLPGQDVRAGHPQTFGGAGSSAPPSNTGAALGAGESGNGAPMSGFASRYLPGPGSADILQRQPEIVLGDWMKSQGMGNNGGMFGMVAPSADLANALYMLTNGGQLGTDEQMINWMANYFGNQLTPGASGIDIRSAIGNLFNGPGQNQQSPLGSFLTTDSSGNVLDPRGQVSRLGSMVDAASQYGVPLIMQQALSGAMGQLSRDYLSRSAQGGMSTGNYNDYINSRSKNILRPFIGS